MFRFPRHDRISRRGFTLLELMIVMALLALMVAMVWPALSRPLQRSATQQAGRQLLEDLGRARLNAIESGRTMAVRYEPGGVRYSIMPADASLDSDDVRVSSSSESDATAQTDSDVPAIDLVIEGRLDDDVVFQDPAAADDLGIPLDSALGDMLADEMAETEAVEPLVQDETAEVGWSAPVLIYPTGRAENGSFVLLGPKGYFLTVTLRGLTGAVSVGPLQHQPRAAEQRGRDDQSNSRSPTDESTESFDAQGIFK